MKNMKRKNKIMAGILAVILVLSASFINAGTIAAKAKSSKNTVVLYFSATGTTKSVAKKIQKNTKGKLIEIKASDPYTEEDLDYNDDDSRVSKEQNSADSPAESSVRPGISNLKAIKKAVKKADVVYIGYPIWWGEAPHIMYTLVEGVSLKRKTVVPFCTSASSGMGDSGDNLKTKAQTSSKTKWLDGRNFYGTSSKKTVNKWIKSLKL